MSITPGFHLNLNIINTIKKTSRPNLMTEINESNENIQVKDIF